MTKDSGTQIHGKGKGKREELKKKTRLWRTLENANLIQIDGSKKTNDFLNMIKNNWNERRKC